MTVARIAPGNAKLYAAIAGLMTVSIAIQVTRDRGWNAYEPDTGVMWIRSAPLAERLALSFDSLAADVYWMRAVVYYGGQRLNPRVRNFDQLYPLLDLVTSLDPRFNVAYRFGAIFLAEPSPGGAGRPDLAVDLLQKGLVHQPNRWEYALDAGFVHYWWGGDYSSAAAWFKRAFEIPGAPEWLGPLAATTLAEGGNRDSSRRLWTEIRTTTDIEWVHRTADRRLQQLDALDAIDDLNQRARGFIERRGRPPADWRELAADQRWRGLPLDPSGTPFDLDATGNITLSRESRLWPLPTGASAGMPGGPRP